MDNEIFARVENNRIVQFPVTREIINERNAPTETYYRCYFPDEHPVVELHQKLVYAPRLVGEAVYVFESVEARSIDEMFSYLYSVAGEDTSEGLALDRSKVTDALYVAFVEVVKVHVQKALDAFAKTRGYDDVKSACGYLNSTISQYQNEARRCSELQDATWSQLFNYLGAVRAGVLPLPMRWSDIAACIPPYTWEVT